MGEVIGMIGVGLLGSAIAERLLAEGFAVAGYDTRADRRQALEAIGGTATDSVTGVAERCPRILLSLPNSGVSRAVLEEIGGAIRAGTILVDTTTGDPRQIETFGPPLAQRGVGYLDATVGGSSREARARDVIVMVGGERAHFDACRDVFAAFARGVYHVGPWGSGARMKLVTNLVLGLNRAVLAEGLGFAKACGLDPGRTLEILKSSSSYSRAMDSKGAKMIMGDFRPDARLSQHLKDVRLILENATRAGCHLPLSELHRSLLEDLERLGHGDADNAAIALAFGLGTPGGSEAPGNG